MPPLLSAMGAMDVWFGRHLTTFLCGSVFSAGPAPFRSPGRPVLPPCGGCSVSRPIDGVPESLLTADAALRCLDAGVAEQKTDLIRFSTPLFGNDNALLRPQSMSPAALGNPRLDSAVPGRECRQT